MGRVFISAGHGGLENGIPDPGAIAGNTTEAQEMIALRDLIVADLRARNFEVLAVPDDLSSEQTINWINRRYQSGDIALELHTGSSTNPTLRGTTVFYIGNNDQRKANAELMLFALLRRVPGLRSLGVKPDTQAPLGSFTFCRQVIAPSIYMEVVYLTNPEDRNLLQTKRREFAVGLADGLASWSRAVSGNSPSPSPNPTYTAIDINVNGGIYGEKGIIINDNAYVPIDLVSGLNIDLSQAPNVRRVSYGNVVYVRAVDLRDFNIAVSWESASRTVILQTQLKICTGQFDKIMGHGNTSEMQLTLFLKTNNEPAIAQFPDLPRLFREEATIEGINYDIAFAQMCVETNFLRFGGPLKPEQNNFGGLGSITGSAGGASFPSARIGVRAQIQHLKAYASTEPIVQEIVDPRFRFVTRGIAPLVGQLSGRWSADPQYGDKVLAILRRLYESANFL